VTKYSRLWCKIQNCFFCVRWTFTNSTWQDAACLAISRQKETSRWKQWKAVIALIGS